LVFGHSNGWLILAEGISIRIRMRIKGQDLGYLKIKPGILSANFCSAQIYIADNKMMSDVLGNNFTDRELSWINDTKWIIPPYKL